MRYSYAQPSHGSGKKNKIGGPTWTITGYTHQQNFDIVAEDKRLKKGK